jgi:gamma-carbonic anhydrase
LILAFQGTVPQIHAEAFIEQSAQVIGDVVIGAQSSVWFYSVIRGDVNYIRIGERTNIQDCCMVHVTLNKFPTFIGSDTTVGHRALIHGAKVGDHCLIGMGAILLDGVEIGDYSLVGAGAVVPPGMKVPPRTLVMGVPAKVVRAMTEEDIERIKHQGLEYLSLAKRYQGGAKG